jgi:hypothetical protein
VTGNKNRAWQEISNIEKEKIIFEIEKLKLDTSRGIDPVIVIKRIYQIYPQIFQSFSFSSSILTGLSFVESTSPSHCADRASTNSSERLNQREYKDAFLLQDINTKMHKLMVLMCSATLNRLEITQ